MLICNGQNLGVALCEALGINPSSTTRIILDCRHDAAAKVVIHSYAETADGKIDTLKSQVQKYELTEK